MSEFAKTYLGESLIYDDSLNNPYKAEEFVVDGKECEEVHIGNTCVFAKPGYRNHTLRFRLSSDGYSNSRFNYNLNGQLQTETYKKDSVFEKNVHTLTTCNYMFYNSNYYLDGCYLKEIISIPDTYNVKDMTYMFYRMGSSPQGDRYVDIPALDDMDTSNVEDMSNMFNISCITSETTKRIGKLNVSNVKNLHGIFSSAKFENGDNILDLHNWNIDKAENCNQMFSGIDSNKPVKMTIDISGWKFKNKSCEDFFIGSNISRIILTDCDFTGSINGFITNNMFAKMSYYYPTYYPVEIIGPVTGISFNISSHDTNLTHDSKLVLLNGLSEVSEKRSIYFKSISDLTEEEIAIATSKGWNVGVN